MTSTSNADTLPVGTLLDKRYEIKRVIGKGGFGITYEATNIVTGQRVAVKAWTGGDKTGFLREARTLHDFASEKAVVTVLDYLEENNAAFLVMEYLDGITLREYVEQNGIMPAETVVRLFVPIFEALERIHAAGIIHRDISPDNLMVLGEEGMREGSPAGNISLKLMDFGAAKSYEGANVTHSVIYKPSYSPPEQMDPEGVMGSYTDVYALCGTIYYCITGRAPEDVVSRLLLDELEPPSALGADILPAAEKILLSGMALDCTERVQTVKALSESLCRIYPDLSEEEKRTEQMRRIRRRQKIAAGIAVAFAILLIIGYWNRVRLRFLLEETTTATLSGNDMSEEEFSKSAAIVQERIRTFSKGWYLWEQIPSEKKILFTVPTKLFGLTDPQNYTRTALSRPMVLSARLQTSNGLIADNLGVFDKKTDLVDVREEDNVLYVRFSDEAAVRFRGVLEETDRDITLYFDQKLLASNYSAPILSYDFKTVGDGNTVYAALDPFKEDANSEFIPIDLVKLHLTQDTFDKYYSVYTSFSVRWEDPTSAMMPGRRQVREDKVPGRTILLRFPLPDPAENKQHGADPQYYSALVSLQIVLKNRLDAMDIPYAAGTDVYDSNSLVFKVPLDHLWYIEAENLSKTIHYSLYLGSQYSRDSNLGISFQDLYIEDSSDGSFKLVMVPYDETPDKWKSFADILRSQGSDVFLYFNYHPVASCSLDEFLASIEESGTIPFVKWELPGTGEMNAETRHFAALLESGFMESPQKEVYPDEVFVEYAEGKLIGTLKDNDIRLLMPDYLPEDQKDLPSRWADRYGRDKYIFKYNTSQPYYYYIRVGYCDLNDPEQAMSILRDIKEKDAASFKAHKIRTLDMTYYDKAPENYQSAYVSVTYETDFDSMELKPTYVYTSYRGEEEARLTALWKKAVDME